MTSDETDLPRIDQSSTYLVEERLINDYDYESGLLKLDIGKNGGHQLQIYDLAGQREEGAHPLDHLQAVVLKEADFLIFFFALDNLQSFVNIKKWYDEIKAAYEG